MGQISALAVDAAAGRAGRVKSFAVRARRTGTHPFSSQELARTVGGAILERFPHLSVDLDDPELEVFVEVRATRTYVYLGRMPGPGGLPLGVAGSVIALVDGPRGALGAYLMMKRGCRASVVSTGEGDRLAREILTGFDPKLEVRTIEPTDSWESSIDELVRVRSADGVVLPLTVEDYPAARDRWGDRVIFSPTVGLTDPEVSGRWQSIESLLA
ncbi:MAG: THUMP domain-containing protein, partial [Thermoplasmata archaeon]